MGNLQASMLFLLRTYRWTLSPAKNALLGGPCCRFTPTCSQYAIEAIGRHGAAHGASLAMRRVCRCHPWAPGGHDPVPEAVNG
jgi:putative membrane protein insertion efficiency factor